MTYIYIYIYIYTVYIYTRTPTRLHYPARLRARVMRIKLFIANKIYDVKRGGGGRGGVPALSITMMLIFPKNSLDVPPKN